MIKILKKNISFDYLSIFSKKKAINDINFISGFSHINITVPNVNEAIEYYSSLLGCRSIRIFEKFKNIGFAKSAGFINHPEKIEVTIAFVEIPQSGITLELMHYHNPLTKNMVKKVDVNVVGGVRHIALKVNDIDTAFSHIKSHKEISFINPSKNYKPCQIDNISTNEFHLFDEKLESDWEEKEKVCTIVGGISYFYFIDKYGVQWEFEQGHHDLGNEVA